MTSYTTIPTPTLNALKNMLFSNDGVDLSNIINDLTAEEENRDLNAINVALAYKGAKVEIGNATRYCSSFRERFYRYTFIGYSIILNQVKTRRAECHIDEHGDIAIDKELGITAMPLGTWLNYPTDVAELFKNK